MRADTVTFAQANSARARNPRFVIEVAFDATNSTLRYFTSHADAATPIGATVVAGVIQGISGTSQTLKPDTAAATIGNINFTLVDVGGAVTTALGGQLALGRSTRLQRVRVYMGYEGFAWADYVLVQTQLVQDIAYNAGAYKFGCLDVQRQLRNDVFDVAKTTLTLSALASDTTINVVGTGAFAMLEHGTSYSDAPSVDPPGSIKVGYIRIENEIIRYTGISGTSFTGCTRGALGTIAVDHLVDPSATTDQTTPVAEYVYFELPLIKALYAILTGRVLGTDNLFLRSEEFDNASWSKTNVTVTADDVAGPDGTLTADKLAATASAATSISQAATVAATKATFSVYIKKGSGATDANRYAVRNATTATTLLAVTVNFDTKAISYITGSAGASIEDAPGGWLRLTLSVSSGISSGNSVSALIAFDGSSETAGEFSYAWGAQLNADSIAWPYARTTSAARAQASFPSGWNLGISTDYVRLADFVDPSKRDLYDPLDDLQAFTVRFEDLEKTDGKKFCETELALLAGAFMPVYADGTLGFRRQANMLTGAGYVAQLDDDPNGENNVVEVDDLEHDFNSLHNVLAIKWNWEPLQSGGKGDFTRENVLLDAGSIAIYGRAAPLVLSFRGLHGSRHSATALQRLFDAIRDRYTGPPQRIKPKALGRMNVLEVADVVRLRLRSVRDYVASSSGLATLDRSFEIQNVAIDWISGEVGLDLMASSKRPDEVPATGDATVLTSAWRTGTGTSLASALGGALTGSAPAHISSNATLNGSADMNAAASIYYIDDDLQLDSGKTLTITGNVQIRSKFFQRNGEIDGKGGGLAGAAAFSGTPAGAGDFNGGTKGFIGTTEAGGGLINATLSVLFGTTIVWAVNWLRGPVVAGANAVVPQINLAWDGVTLDGIPTDLRGTSGSSGGPVVNSPSNLKGGAGGAGGAGLCIVCTGYAGGVAGAIDLSGADGSPGQSAVFGPFTLHAGSGAGGAPGGLLVLLDGALATATGLNDTGFVALQGKTPIIGQSVSDFQQLQSGDVRSDFVGTGDGTTFPLPNLSGARGGSRVQYIPANVTANADPDQPDTILGQIADAFILNNWTRQQTDSTQTLQGMRYMPGAPYPYACGGTSATGDIVVSKDAARWERKTNPTAGAVADFAWNGTCAIAVGGSGATNLLLRSTDMVTWTQQTVPDATKVLSSVVWSSSLSLFIAVGAGSIIWTSPDGVTWTARTAANAGTNFVAFANGIAIAGGSSGGNALIQYSTNGTSWTAASIDNATGYGINGIVFGNGRWVAVGGEKQIATSIDNGATWTKGADLPAPFRSTVGATRKVDFSGDVFAVAGVADTGTSQGALAVSRDGKAWAARTGPVTQIRGIAYGAGFWLACGNAEGGTGYIATTIRT